MRLYNSWNLISWVNRNAPIIPRPIEKLEIRNKMCVLLHSKESYDFFNYIVNITSDFNRDVILLYCGNENILTVLENQYNLGYRIFLSDHDDDDLININSFKYINDICVFNSNSTQDSVMLSTHIIRSSTPDYNYSYFIITNLLYNPKAAFSLLSQNNHVDLTKLYINITKPTIVDTLVYIYVEGNELSIKILETILLLNELMGNIIVIKSFPISLTSSDISPELTTILSTNNISNPNYIPMLFYVNANNKIEANILLSILSSNSSFADNYILLNDIFLLLNFYKKFKYCFIIARNFSQEGKRFSDLLGSDLTPYHYVLYDFLLYLSHTISNNTSDTITFLEKLNNNNTIVSNNINPRDTMQYFMPYFYRNPSFIFVIDSNLKKIPVIYEVKNNLFTVQPTTYTTSLYQCGINETIVYFKFTKSGGLSLVNSLNNNATYKWVVSNDNGLTWYTVTSDMTTKIVGSAVYEITRPATATKPSTIDFIFIIADNTTFYFTMFNQNSTSKPAVEQITFSSLTNDDISDIGIASVVFSNLLSNITGHNIVGIGPTLCNFYFDGNGISDEFKNLVPGFVISNFYTQKFKDSNVSFTPNYNIINNESAKKIYQYNNLTFTLCNNKFYFAEGSPAPNYNLSNGTLVLTSTSSTTSDKTYPLVIISTPTFSITDVKIFEQGGILMMYYCILDKLYVIPYTTFYNYLIGVIKTNPNWNIIDGKGVLSNFPVISSITNLPGKILNTFNVDIKELSCNSNGNIIYVVTNLNLAWYSNSNYELYPWYSNSNYPLYPLTFSQITLTDTQKVVSYIVTDSDDTFLCCNNKLFYKQKNSTT